jgi:hypothetical protein
MFARIAPECREFTGDPLLARPITSCYVNLSNSMQANPEPRPAVGMSREVPIQEMTTLSTRTLEEHLDSWTSALGERQLIALQDKCTDRTFAIQKSIDDLKARRCVPPPQVADYKVDLNEAISTTCTTVPDSDTFGIAMETMCNANSLPLQRSWCAFKDNPLWLDPLPSEKEIASMLQEIGACDPDLDWFG